MAQQKPAQGWFNNIFGWIRNNAFIIILLVAGCILIGLAIALVPSLISIYLPDHSVEVATSNENATDLWSVRYFTNITDPHLIVTRAASPYDKSGLGRSFDMSMGLPSPTMQVQGARLGTSSQRFRRQDTIQTTGAPIVYFEVILQALYPHRCFRVVRCKNLFRQRVLSKFLNNRRFPFSALLFNGRNIGLELRLDDLIQYYVIPTTEEPLSTSTTNSPSTTTTSAAPIPGVIVTTATPIPTTTITTTTTTTTTTTICALSFQTVWSMSGITVAGSASGISGSGLSQLNTPIPIYYDQPNNNIIVGDSSNQRVIQFSLDNPALGGTVLAGGNGAGCSLNQFQNVVGVALDSSRQLYVSDSQAACPIITKFPPNSNSGTTGTLAASPTKPEGIFINPMTNDLYVADYGAHSVLKFANGGPTSVVVAGGNGAGTASNQLNHPNNVYFDYLYTNALYVADTDNHRVMKFPSGSTSATFGTVVAGSATGLSGSTSNLLNNPRDMVVGNGGIVFVSDASNNRIQRWLPSATSGDTIIGGTLGAAANQLNFPESIALDRNRNFLVVDRGNNRVQSFQLMTC